MAAFSLQALFAVLLLTSAASANDCRPTDQRCEFWLVVTSKMTMIYKRTTILTVPHQGELYAFNDIERSHRLRADDVVTGDGFLENRLVYVINGTSPGPKITVYENQEVVVHVRNELMTETLSIHWHGLHQRGTPWMDGVAYVTQWPILPRWNYTYRFKAVETGTHWYHSHSRLQRTMGLYGAFVVKPSEEIYQTDLEHTLLITDYNHDDTTREAYAKWTYGTYKHGAEYKAPSGPDGVGFGHYESHSGLINGRGRYVDPVTGKDNEAPLSIFKTIQGATLRLRLISAADIYAFRFAIESHKFKVVSSDGADLDPVEVDAVLIYPGESYDVIVDCTGDVRNYKISAKMVLLGVNIYAESILHYEGAPDVTNMAAGDHLKCPYAGKPCVFLNCPQPDITSYQPNVSCIFIDQVQSLDESEEYETIPEKQTFFLNFAYPHPPTGYNGGSVNARRFPLPNAPPLLTGTIENNCSACVPEEGKLCFCNYAVEVKMDTVVRLVLMNVGQGMGTLHPIHLHGHYFRVLKLGFGVHNSSGSLVKQSEEIDCQSRLDPSESYCFNATWSNRSWFQNLPGANLDGVWKDTVLIPSGGYTVVELVADNPGYWIMHCHQEIHVDDGIALLFISGKEHIGSIPPEVPHTALYGDFRHQNGDVVGGDFFRNIVGILSGSVAMLLLVILAGVCRARKKRAQRRGRGEYAAMVPGE